MINEIIASIAGNIPTIIAIYAVYLALKHLIRQEMDIAIKRLDEKVITLNALRNLRKT